MAQKNDKTNVMRILDAKKIAYAQRGYNPDGDLSGAAAARAMGVEPERVFKTLVTAAASGEHYVFVIPVETELNLKKAAKAVGEKSVEMLRQKELLPLTGYVHGGCSPIGMKKLFTTTVDETAQLFDTIIFSAGKIGHQVEVSPADLGSVIPISFADIAE